MFPSENQKHKKRMLSSMNDLKKRMDNTSLMPHEFLFLVTNGSNRLEKLNTVREEALKKKETRIIPLDQ